MRDVDVSPLLELFDVQLPGTTVLPAGRLDSAALRPLNGHDEMFLLEHREHFRNGPALADALLARCTPSFRLDAGEAQPAIDLLTLGDREALLLSLYELSFGRRLALVVNCPAEECGKPMDLPYEADRLRLERDATFPAEHSFRVGATDRTLTFRLPTRQDIATAALENERDAADVLAEACLLAPNGPLSTEEIEALGSEFARLDPQAVLDLNVTCIYCGHAFVSTLLADALLLAEAAARRPDLETSVLLLAMHHHWSERSILDLPSSRRRRYAAALISLLSGPAGLE